MTKPSPSTRPTKRPAAPSWLSRSFRRLFGKPRKASPAHPGNRPTAPAKAETALLPPFAGLSPEQIHVPKTKADCQAAAGEILAAGVAGFDTEAKPTFKVGEKSTGPHVVQFALTDKAFIFQLHRGECQKVAAELIASERVLKVGFGLKNDHGQIRNRLGVKLHNVLDLDHIFRQRGYKGQIGVRAAIGAVMKLNFPKSKTISKSNWSAAQLTPGQLRYAANDAYAALKIMEALDLKPAEISSQRRH